jgi:hypothetical protein
LQKAIEAVEGYLARQKKYDDYNHSFGNRNSFSKTDRDATFMRMKEDHMKNGQLKPGYNVTLAVDAEYIVSAMISQERSDTSTFIPMMEKLHPLGYTRPVADAGFESEENYTWCEENGQSLSSNLPTMTRPKPRNIKVISANERTCPTMQKTTPTSAMQVIRFGRRMRKKPSQRRDTP